MGVSPAVFQSAGQRSEHYVPGAYSRSEAIGGYGDGVSANNGVILGRSKGGEPEKLFNFLSVDEARDTLVDGELLKAVAHAFNPSPIYSPQSVRAVVVNGNTQARSVMKFGNEDVLLLKTASYGLPANSISRRLVDGTQPGTKKIIFASGETEDKIDNIGKKSMRLQYTGDGSRAVLAVNDIGVSVEVTRQQDDLPALDITGFEHLRVGETKPFSVEVIKPSADEIIVVADIILSGIDVALLKLEYFDHDAGDTWVEIDTSQPFRGPSGFELQSGTLQFRITPLEGSDSGILSYAIKLRQVVGGVITSTVIASTTTGQIKIVSENEPYSGYYVPAYDSNSESMFLTFEDFPTVSELVQRFNASGAFAAVLSDDDTESPSNELDIMENVDIKDTAQTLTSNFYALLHALETSPWVGKGNVSKVDGASNKMPDNDAEPVYFEGASAGTHTIADWNKALFVLETENIQIISTPATDHAVHTLISNHCTAMSNVQNRKERTALLGGGIGETIEDAVAFSASLNNKLVSYCHPSIFAASPLTGETEHLPASYFACKLMGMECAVAVNESLTWKSVSVLKFGTKLKTGEMEKLIIGGVLCGGITDDNRLAVIRAMTTYQGKQLQLVERSMVREDLYMNRDLRAQYSTGVGRPGLDRGSVAEQVLLDAARAWKGAGLIVPTDGGKFVWGIKIRKSGDKTYVEFNRNLVAPQNFFFITAYNYVYESATSVEV